jgi:hypothetical protein
MVIRTTPLYQSHHHLEEPKAPWPLQEWLLDAMAKASRETTCTQRIAAYFRAGLFAAKFHQLRSRNGGRA